MICAICSRDCRGLGFNLALAWTTEHYTLRDHQIIQATSKPHYLVAACSQACLDTIAMHYRRRTPMKTNLLEEKAMQAAVKAAGGKISSLSKQEQFRGMSPDEFAAIIRAAVLGFTEHMAKNSPDIREPMEKTK